MSDIRITIETVTPDAGRAIERRSVLLVDVERRYRSDEIGNVVASAIEQMTGREQWSVPMPTIIPIRSAK